LTIDWKKILIEKKIIELKKKRKEEKKMDSHQLPMEFYFFDARWSRNDCSKAWLFGKIFDTVENKWVSCCVFVECVERVLFVKKSLETNNGKFLDEQSVRAAFCAGTSSQRAPFEILSIESQQKRRTATPATMDWYWRVAYRRRTNAGPDTASMLPSFRSDDVPFVTHAYASPVERFLVERRVTCPSWLFIADYRVLHRIAVNEVSPSKMKTRVALAVRSIGSITPMPAPPSTSTENVLKKCSVFFDFVDSLSSSSAPTLVSFTMHALDTNETFHFARKLSGGDNESEEKNAVKKLYDDISRVFFSIDPDVVIGYGLHRHALPRVLVEGSSVRSAGVGFFGRFDTGVGYNASILEWPDPKEFPLDGRLYVDLKTLDETYSKNNYRTDALEEFVEVRQPTSEKDCACTNRLECAGSTRHVSLYAREVFEVLSRGDTDTKEKYARNCHLACQALLENHDESFELTRELTTMCGNLWRNNILPKSNADRLEMLIVHRLHELNFVVESRPFHDDDGDATTTYQGGMVLGKTHRQRNHTGYSALLDVASMYPTIMFTERMCILPSSSQSSSLPLEETVVPCIISKFVEGRRECRRRLTELTIDDNDASTRRRLQIRERALKLVPNQLYGLFGSSFFRFRRRYLAEAVAARGRVILEKMVEVCRADTRFDVSFGHTDSMLVDFIGDSTTTPKTLDDVRAIFAKLAVDCSSTFPGFTVKVEAVFRKVVVFKRTEYAALLATTTNNILAMEAETSAAAEEEEEDDEVTTTVILNESVIKGCGVTTRNVPRLASVCAASFLNALWSVDDSVGEKMLEAIVKHALEPFSKVFANCSNVSACQRARAMFNVSTTRRNARPLSKYDSLPAPLIGATKQQKVRYGAARTALPSVDVIVDDGENSRPMLLEMALENPSATIDWSRFAQHHIHDTFVKIIDAFFPSSSTTMEKLRERLIAACSRTVGDILGDPQWHAVVRTRVRRANDDDDASSSTTSSANAKTSGSKRSLAAMAAASKRVELVKKARQAMREGVQAVYGSAALTCFLAAESLFVCPLTVQTKKAPVVPLELGAWAMRFFHDANHSSSLGLSLYCAACTGGNASVPWFPIVETYKSGDEDDEPNGKEVVFLTTPEFQPPTCVCCSSSTWFRECSPSEFADAVCLSLTKQLSLFSISDATKRLALIQRWAWTFSVFSGGDLLEKRVSLMSHPSIRVSATNWEEKFTLAKLRVLAIE
jgi:hypothetical protein